MTHRLELTEVPIKPIYFQRAPNESIQLGSVQLQFALQGQTYRETAKATMRFVPNDRLLFVIPLEGKPPFFGHGLIGENGWDETLTLVVRGVRFDALCSSVGHENGIIFQPKTSGITVSPPSDAITRSIFHLFNFPDFSGPDEFVLKSGKPPTISSTRCGRANMNVDGWAITIAATRETHDFTKALKAQGGYIITHVGQIQREDSSTFSSGQLQDLLQCLHYFLSFTLGRWSGLALAVGFDASDNRAFEEWGMPMSADGSWNGSCSWFDLHHGEFLSQVFPGFIGLWKNELWRRPLTEALYWYLGASDRGTGIGVDTGLILAQTALELLSWNYCVRDQKMVSSDAFKPRGLSAADKLRILVSSLNIPLEIPDGLRALEAKRGKKWTDSMDAITGIRNGLVHPDSEGQLPDGSYYDAWRLSLWYLDLILLRLCGHNGKYANRLTQRYVGSVEPLPWAKG